jgi:hypothetical protein
MSGDERLEAVAERLDAISEELGELAMALLRDAIAEGATSRPADEKRLSQARRAVDKASHLLRSGGAPAQPDD